MNAWASTTPAEKIWVCKVGDAILCAFVSEQAAAGWCREANENGIYRPDGIVYAVETWLNR